ncbi:MAG: tRNA (N(6)-L-threonylcarbamoyladenosine(37)-C(2))-methylthiotransferase MtaB [Firmicutes bacterium]|nr:tRNA (N(6)-L-threonylcarbamoyladenosine(37)-C(2))-methylthiotransferase MtaB [Bacillota bacterium]
MPNQHPYRAAICTMGCKVNSYESAQIMEALKQSGFQMVEFHDPADVYIINTCTVTQVAAKKSRQMIHRARTQNPKALVVATGCYVDRDDELMLEGVIDLAVSNQKKEQLVEIVKESLHSISDHQRPASISAMRMPTPDSQEQHIIRMKTRAVIKIQDGCRQYCSYCIIPFVRGPLKSRPIEEIVEEANQKAQQGYKEIVLTGIHLSSYGLDWQEISYNAAERQGIFIGSYLADLILKLQNMQGIERIRLGSLEPRLITAEFVESLKTATKLCPHFHLSLQSGSDKTLKAMNRHYTAAEFEQAVRLLREHFKDAAITTDIIAGFPGETEQDHQESLAFAEKIAFAEAHIFPYSRMEGTVAGARKDQIPQTVKKQRVRDLLDVTAKSTKAFMDAMQGKTVKLLLEEQIGEREWIGTTPGYLRVAVCTPDEARGEAGSTAQAGFHAGEIVTVRINGYTDARSTNHQASGLSQILKAELTGN